jgi:hypothetical protein
MPGHERGMTLAPIVILITLPVLISLFSRNYRRSIRAEPRAGGVAATAVVMPAHAGIHAFLMAFDQSLSFRRINSAIFLTTSSSIPA